MQFIHLVQIALTAKNYSINIFDVFIVFLLVFINAFFVAAEMAIITINRSLIQYEADNQDKVSEKIVKVIKSKHLFLSTIQICITLAGFLSSAVGAARFSPYLYELIDPKHHYPWVQNVCLVLITLIIVFFSLVLGELVPKHIAISNPKAVLKFSSRILFIMMKIFSPLTKIISVATNFILKMLNIKTKLEGDAITEEEIRVMVEASRLSGQIHSDEGEMIKKVFEFNDIEVSEIMTPRTKIFALPIETEYDRVIDAAAKERYSRIPIYEDNIDCIVGVLYLKDIFKIINYLDKETFHLRNVMREPFFVPESNKIDLIFKAMNKKSKTMAIVIDEYGVTSGLITIEDMIEEIFGNIQDEFDQEEHSGIKQIDQHRFFIDGLVTIADAAKKIPELSVIERRDEYDTIAGFVLFLLKRIPSQKEQAKVYFENLKFIVIRMENQRIAKVELSILPQENVKQELNYNDESSNNNHDD